MIHHHNKKTMKMMNILFYVLCLVISSIGHIVDGHFNFKEDFELERQLNLINKYPIKSIQTNSGHIVDCVDIYKQAAFDHSLLGNHTLQRKPNFKTSVKNSSNKFISALEKVDCPKETVPIRRTTKDDLIQDKSLFKDYILDQNSARSYSVYAYLRGADYYGVSGTAGVYNPKVSSGQTSASALYVQNGEGDGTDRIVVGWNVHPQLYNDEGTYLFSLWTSGTSGCYNTQCSGFVQTDNSYYLGSRVKKTSNYGDREIVELPVSIFQDEKTQNWWLSVEKKTIGYFPANLFSNLNKANEVAWGGLARSNEGASATDPPMGSGHLPDGDVTHSGYFSHIQFVNQTRQDIRPKFKQVETSNKAPDKCYGIRYRGKKVKLGCLLLFGGPGGACGN